MVFLSLELAKWCQTNTWGQSPRVIRVLPTLFSETLYELVYVRYNQDKGRNRVYCSLT